MQGLQVLGPSFMHTLRVWVLVAALYITVHTASLGETAFESRYQYYQEDDGRIRVDSDYSLFSIDLSDTLLVDGTLLYSAISGASPTGTPASSYFGQVPIANLEDERYAATLNVTKNWDRHSLRLGTSFSEENDYISRGFSATDTIHFNQKNTDLVLGFAYANDTVGAVPRPDLNEQKQTYDWIVGINQVLSPRSLLSVTFVMGYKEGFLSEAYKSALIDGESFWEERPDTKLEQMLTTTYTHELISDSLSVETSYRFGHNDYGITSHTASVAFYKYLLKKRLSLRPSFRYYRQSEADFYALSFSGDPDVFSSDYRVSAEETFNIGLQLRYRVTDQLFMDLGYERYITRGTDGVTSQSAYPDAHSVSAGFRYIF
jgi:hypothetical protein